MPEKLMLRLANASGCATEGVACSMGWKRPDDLCPMCALTAAVQLDSRTEGCHTWKRLSESLTQGLTSVKSLGAAIELNRGGEGPHMTVVIRTIQSDNAREFMFGEFKGICQTNNIVLRHTSPHLHQNNSLIGQRQV